MYYHECDLYGCSFSEMTVDLVPKGETKLEGPAQNHQHDWNKWVTTAGRDDTYMPPWKYKRECRLCKAQEMAEDLEKKNP